MNEFEIIARFFKPLSDEKHGLGLVDDAALVKPAKGCEFVISTDALVQDVHFIGLDNARSIAHKALGVNVSDIIAKGAVPKYYLLTLSYPPSLNENNAWFADFSAGLKAVQDHYGMTLIGGDSVRTAGPLMVSVTMIGELPAGQMVKRSTAKAGNFVYVSGTIGDSVIGLALKRGDKRDEYSQLSASETAYFLDRYDFPQPKVGLIGLIQAFATASMDVSDGLIGDLEKLCVASNVGATCKIAEVPVQSSVAKQAFDNVDFLKELVTGGDDYAVLMTVSAATKQDFEQAALKADIKVAKIGIITDSRIGFSYYDQSGNMIEFSHKSYCHF